MSLQQPNSRKFRVIKPLSGAFIIFGFVAFLPLLGAHLVGNGWKLTCQRAKLGQEKCEVAIESFFESERFSFELSALASKVVKSDERDHETGEYCYLPAIIVTQNNSFRVVSTPNICSEREASRIVSRINHFISTPTEAQLNIHGVSWKEVLLYSSPWLLIGLLMSALVARDSFSNCIFDLDRNYFMITTKNWFRTKNVEEHSLDEIVTINLETQDNGMSIEDQVIIKLKSGKSISLPQANCSNQKLVFELKQFLNLQ
ncbi:MAG: hypothetical protein HC799_19500 [Limnothrix sp. RL_2_0]|nr:hypothetical protein [Limnothrix sp. RL_2_0]